MQLWVSEQSLVSPYWENIIGTLIKQKLQYSKMPYQMGFFGLRNSVNKKTFQSGLVL